MAPPIPTTVPVNITAGDSLAWTRSIQDYPASDGWSLSYQIIGPTAIYTVNAVVDVDGADFDINVDAATTASWAPGTYRVSEILTNGDQRATMATTTLIIAPNPATSSYVKSHAEKMLAAIDAWLESKAPTAGELEINGRRIQNYPLNELLAMRDKYAAIVAREQAGAGQVAGTRVLVRF